MAQALLSHLRVHASGEVERRARVCLRSWTRMLGTPAAAIALSRLRATTLAEPSASRWAYLDVDDLRRRAVTSYPDERAWKSPTLYAERLRDYGDGEPLAS